MHTHAHAYVRTRTHTRQTLPHAPPTHTKKQQKTPLHTNKQTNKPIETKPAIQNTPYDKQDLSPCATKHSRCDPSATASEVRVDSVVPSLTPKVAMVVDGVVRNYGVKPTTLVTVGGVNVSSVCVLSLIHI